MLKQGPDWFLVAIEACGGGTPNLSSVLEVFRVRRYIWVQGVRRWTSGFLTRQGGAPPTLVGSPGLPWRALQVHQVGFLPKLTSPVDFVPFRLRLIFLFFETLK